MRRRQNKSAGWATIIAELIGLSIMMIVMASAAPAWIQVRAGVQQTDALARIRQYGNAVATSGLCSITTGCVTPSNVAAVASWSTTFASPMVIEGYRWSYSLGCGTDGFGCMTAVPNTTWDGRYSFFIDDTNIVHCKLGQTINATAPVCSF